MAKDPAFMLNSADFLARTYDMKSDQVGKYIILMCLQHQKGHLSLPTIAVVMPRFYDEKVMEMFVKDENGEYYDPILEAEMIRRKRYGRGGIIHYQWRKAVLMRDGRKCVHCGATNNLHAHHVIPWSELSDGDPLRYDAENGITLCKRCHLAVHGGRWNNG